MVDGSTTLWQKGRMDRTTIRRVGQPLAWLASLGGEIWTLVSWCWGGGLKVLGELGPPEYAALTAMFGAVFLYSSWTLAQPLRPSRRLESMIDEMTTVRGLVGQNIDYDTLLSGYDEEKARKLARALDELKIPHPPVTGETVVEDWHRFLIRLGAEARVRNIRSARRLWKEMACIPSEYGHQ